MQFLKPRRTTATLSLLGAVVLAVTPACSGGGGGDGDGDPDPTEVPAEDAPVTLDDVVDLGDLVTQEMEATSAATQVGDPADLLRIAQDSGERIRAHVTSVLDRVDNITDREPDRTGETDAGRPYGVWEGERDGVAWRFSAIRINERRVRYLLTGRPAGDENAQRRAVLTGIFVRDPDWAPRRGGGRFHLSMTNLNELGRGPGLEGRIHFVFANRSEDRRARRIVYRNVREAGSNEVRANYAADLIRHVGVGGRFRSMFIDEILPLPLGREIYAMRVAWRAGEGGRGAAAIASLNLGDPVLLGTAHECWDADGLRTFYEDTFDGNDDDNPNGGSSDDCVQLLQREDAPDADVEGQDLDGEVTDVLDEAGANEVDETEADAEEDVPDAN